MPTLLRRTVSEFVGTGFLVAAVVGSGIMGERLAGGNVAIALLANTIATGAALVALIVTFGPISGAHFNPAVTLVDAIEHGVSWTVASCYITAQLFGAVAGAFAAHVMFGLSAISLSHHSRGGSAQAISEFIATFGLLCVIWGCSRRRPEMIPLAVGAYITAAYWFTSSTSFANPRGNHRTLTLRYVRGDSAGRCSVVRPGAVRRSDRGDLVVSLACSGFARESENYSASGRTNCLIPLQNQLILADRNCLSRLLQRKSFRARYAQGFWRMPEPRDPLLRTQLSRSSAYLPKNN
jgi:glycerol uptake facilitator-like aquaporin